VAVVHTACNLRVNRRTPRVQYNITALSGTVAILDEELGLCHRLRLLS
jgi:hypothetical protein